MTSGANRLKANLNRSFGARRNKKSALIKNYESIVVPPFERTTKPTRNKNRTKRHISTNVTTTNTAPPPAITVDKEEDNTTTKRKIRNGNPKQNRMIGVSSALNDLPFNNMPMSNQQHANTNMPMTRRQQQNDSLFNTDSIERFINQQESQSAKKRQHQMQEIVIRERAIQREMKEVALMKQQHMNDLNNNHQQQQQPPMMMNGGGGLDLNAHNSYQNTQKSSFNFNLDMMNNTNVGNGGGLDILRDDSGASNGLSRFRMQPLDVDNDDDEASTSQAIQQEEEPNDNSTQGVLMMPMNDSQPVQLKPLPIRYFNNGVEVNMQGSPLSSITSQSNLLNESAVGGGIQVDGHHVHHTQQKGMEEEKMPSKKQPPIQQPIGMPNAIPQHMMMPQPQLMKPNTNHQMPNNLTTTGTAGAVLTTKKPLNSKKKQSTLPEPSAKLPHKEEDDMPTKAQRKAKKKAAKKEKRKRSTTQQQSRSSKAQKIDKPKIEEPRHHHEVVKKDEPNKMPSNAVKKTVTTNVDNNQMTNKSKELPSLTDKGCTSERSLSTEKKSTNLKTDQKMPESTTKPQSNQSSSATSSSSDVNANFIPKLSTHVSRGPHGDVLDQLFGGL